MKINIKKSQILATCISVFIVMIILLILLLINTSLIVHRTNYSDYLSFWGATIASIIALPFTAIITILVSLKQTRKNNINELRSSIFIDNYKNNKRVLNFCGEYFKEVTNINTQINILKDIFSKNEKYQEEVQNIVRSLNNLSNDMFFKNIYTIDQTSLSMMSSTLTPFINNNTIMKDILNQITLIFIKNTNGNKKVYDDLKENLEDLNSILKLLSNDVMNVQKSLSIVNQQQMNKIFESM